MTTNYTHEKQGQGDAPDALTEMRAALIEAASALATVANNIRREDNGVTPVMASIAYFADAAVARARAAATPHRLRTVDSTKREE
jgi:hypothetical protein